jgi:hypothetical protein
MTLIAGISADSVEGLNGCAAECTIVNAIEWVVSVQAKEDVVGSCSKRKENI